MTETPYNNENNFDDFDIEAKREEWAREREERRVEMHEQRVEEARNSERHLHITMVALFICFVVLALINRETLIDITMNYGHKHGRNPVYGLFLTVWIGAIIDLAAVVIFRKKRELLKSTVQIIICAVLYMAAMLFSFTNLPDAMAVMLFNISRVFALAGAAFTIYPIKYAWTKTQK